MVPCFQFAALTLSLRAVSCSFIMLPVLSAVLRPTSLLSASSACFSRAVTPMRSYAGAGAGADAGPANPAPTSGPQQDAYTGPPKLVVFGGRGFVGSAVCKEALKTGLHVMSVSRSGTPPVHRESWTQDVEWVRGNALEPRTYQELLQGAYAAISCVGGFGSQADMLRVNGTANAAAIATAKAAGVERFVYISAHVPSVPGLEYALSGYIQGKKQAEEELLRSYPQGGVLLRPWVIYGDRAISNVVTLPLGLLFGPVEYALKHIPQAKQLSQLPVVGATFMPPVAVEQVAKVAVAAATDPTFPNGIVDDWQIAEWN